MVLPDLILSKKFTQFYQVKNCLFSSIAIYSRYVLYFFLFLTFSQFPNLITMAYVGIICLYDNRLNCHILLSCWQTISN